MNNRVDTNIDIRRVKNRIDAGVKNIVEKCRKRNTFLKFQQIQSKEVRIKWIRSQKTIN